MFRFTAWLGQNSSYGKQKRLLGEIHTRMTASGNTTADRTGLRKEYLPALRKTLVKPMIDQEKEGIMPVIYDMQACHFPLTSLCIDSQNVILFGRQGQHAA